MQTIDKPKIVIFHPYMAIPGTPAATEHLTYRGQTGTFSLIWHASSPDGTPIDPEFRVHDELTPGGHPISGAPGAAGADGADGVDGTDGAPGMSAYQLAVASGFDGNLAAWLLSLVGPKGDKGNKGDQGDAGADGVDGEDGLTPIPIWNGTELSWEAPLGTEIAAPVDLRGPAGPDGSQVTFSSNVDGTTTVNVGGNSFTVDGGSVRDFEYNPLTGRLWITTFDGNEEEVTLPLPGGTSPTVTVVGTAPVSVTPAATADGTEYTVAVSMATDTAAGVVSLTTAADYPDVANDVDPATPAYVQAAIDAIPAAAVTDVVDLPLPNDFPVAPFQAADTQLDAISYRSMQPVFTNRAKEPLTAFGYMNNDGFPGFALSPDGGINRDATYATEAERIAQAEEIGDTVNTKLTNNNGLFVRISIDAPTGKSHIGMKMPPPRYPGQICTMFFNLTRDGGNGQNDSSQLFEFPIYFYGGIDGAGINGPSRYGIDRIVGNPSPRDFNILTVRDQEVLTLAARTNGSWTVIAHEMHSVLINGVKEVGDGSFEAHGTFDTNAIPNRELFVLPLPIAADEPLSTANTRVFLQDHIVGAGNASTLVNASAACGATFIWRPNAASQNDSVLVAWMHDDTLADAPGYMGYSLRSTARIDYEALGGAPAALFYNPWP